MFISVEKQVYFYKSQGRHNTNYSNWYNKRPKSSKLRNYSFLTKEKNSTLENETTTKEKTKSEKDLRRFLCWAQIFKIPSDNY